MHKVLGYGFLEKVYQNALMVELAKRGIRAEKERPLKIHYESEVVGDYVCDIVVEDKVRQGKDGGQMSEIGGRNQFKSTTKSTFSC